MLVVDLQIIKVLILISEYACHLLMPNIDNIMCMLQPENGIIIEEWDKLPNN